MRRSGVLVVYDPHRRYRELCLSLAGDAVAVVDASESSIESREAAVRAFVSLGRGEPGPKELLIYVPARAPVTDEERQADPFAAYTVCGAIFPSGDGDDYLSLCLKAKPDHATEIRRLFEQDPSPSFALIDNIGGGLQWPTLRTLLQAESARDILFALLVPSPKQTEALQANEAWVNEARALLGATLGLKLITRGKTWSSIADELWRFLLFSEFVFDLPSELPVALSNVPRAPEAARPLVEDLCERLRNDARTRATYIERAEQTETELDLPSHCKEIADLGVRDTFPFEERTILAASLRALEVDRLDDIREHRRPPPRLGLDRQGREPGAMGAAGSGITAGRMLRRRRAPARRSCPRARRPDRLLRFESVRGGSPAARVRAVDWRHLLARRRDDARSSIMRGDVTRG